MEANFMKFVELGGTFTAIIIGTILIAFLVSRFFRALIQRSTVVLKTDPTNYVFLRHAATGLVYLIGFGAAIYSLPSLRALASSMLAGAGILAVAVGFASQQALSNVISGLFIIIFKPFRVTDRLTLRTLSGIVEDITLRHTVIKDFENKRIVIPNAVISDEIIVNSNLGDDIICKWIIVSISYDSDVDKAKEIIKNAILNHPLYLDTRSKEDIEADVWPTIVRVVGLEESSIKLQGWAWAASSPDAFVMNCDLLEEIIKTFKKEGIEVPYPHRTIITKNANVEELEG